MKTSAKIVVPATKKMRVWRLVMVTSNGEAGAIGKGPEGSHADAREVADGDPACVQRRQHDDDENDEAEEALETRGESRDRFR
jgi:hypothetical protein